MYNSTLTLSHTGVILNIDADTNDPLLKQGAYLIHKNFTRLFSTPHQEQLLQYLARAFDTCKLECTDIYDNETSYQLRCIVTLPDQAICIISSLKQRKVLSELEEQNFKTLVDINADWVWSFDKNFTLITANPAFFEARKKISNVDLRLGDNIFKQATQAADKKWRPIYERALKGEVFCFEEKRNNMVNEYYVEIYLSPVYNNDNEIIGCLGITRDITERKKSQFAIEGYTQKLEEFALKTSHDLRRPIANISGMTNILSNHGLNAGERVKAVNYISDSVKELDLIVISMIDLIDQYKNKVTE